MPMLQRFAAGRKVLRRDPPVSRGIPTPRRGFLATVAAGLGLASAPAVADEWIVEPDEPGPLMRAWREIQRAEVEWLAMPTAKTIDDPIDIAYQQAHSKIRAAAEQLNRDIAAAAGVDLRSIARDYDPGDMGETIPDAWVREGDALFLLVPTHGCNTSLQVVRDKAERDYFCVRPIVVEGCYSGPCPTSPRPHVSPIASEEDVQLANAVDRYLADLDAHETSGLDQDLGDYDWKPATIAAKERHDKLSEALSDSEWALYSLILETTEPRRLPGGSYSQSVPIYSRRVGNRLVMLRGSEYTGFEHDEFNSSNGYALNLIVADID